MRFLWEKDVYGLLLVWWVGGLVADLDNVELSSAKSKACF
jgi:hypothetical protein